MTQRLLIVEDHPVVATGLRVALRGEGFEVETVDGPTAAAVIDAAEEFKPSLVLLDLRLSRAVGHGADLIPELRALGAEVLVVSAETDELTLGGCVEAGAAGWVGKDSSFDALLRAVKDVLAGRSLLSTVERDALLERVRARRVNLATHLSPFEQLTDREEAVLGSLVEGMAAEEIAQAHYVSITTVRSQIRSILQKLGVRSQLAAVVKANRVGWKLAGPTEPPLTPDPPTSPNRP